MPALTAHQRGKRQLIKANRDMRHLPAGAVHELRALALVNCVALIHWLVRRNAAIMPYDSEIQRVIRALFLCVKAGCEPKCRVPGCSSFRSRSALEHDHTGFYRSA